MSQRGLALVGKVRVGSRGGRHAIIKGVALTGDSSRAVPANGGKESRLFESGLLVLDGGFGFPLAVIASWTATVGRVTAGAIDTEEVLDLRRQVARLVGVLPG